MYHNQHVTDSELSKIRKLDDFDLMMLVSEIHDHGWSMARKTLAIMPVDSEQQPTKETHDRK